MNQNETCIECGWLICEVFFFLFLLLAKMVLSFRFQSPKIVLGFLQTCDLSLASNSRHLDDLT